MGNTGPSLVGSDWENWEDNQGGVGRPWMLGCLDFHGCAAGEAHGEGISPKQGLLVHLSRWAGSRTVIPVWIDGRCDPGVEKESQIPAGMGLERGAACSRIVESWNGGISPVGRDAQGSQDNPKNPILGILERCRGGLAPRTPLGGWGHPGDTGASAGGQSHTLPIPVPVLAIPVLIVPVLPWPSLILH